MKTFFHILMEDPNEYERSDKERRDEIISTFYDEWVTRDDERQQYTDRFVDVSDEFRKMTDVGADQESFMEMEKELKRLSVKVGVSKMLVLGDWRVDRENEITEDLGIIPFPQVETQLLRFVSDEGLIDHNIPPGNSWVMHFHAGAGNGILVSKLKNDPTEPFANGYKLKDYFAEIGYGDYFYYTPEDLLQGCLKDEYQQHPDLTDFIRVIMILVKKRSYFAYEVGETIRAYLEGRYYDFLSQLAQCNLLLINDIYFPVQPGGLEDFSVLAFLGKDPNLLKVIFADLVKFIGELDGVEKIRSDGEFLADSETKIPEGVKRVFAEYKTIGGEEFCKKYFKPNFSETDYDLACDINIYPQNVIPGKFEEVDDVFPKSWPFTLIHSFRSSSHLDDEAYIQFMKTLCLKLVPGGILIDDGMRQSYTRFERIKELQELQNALGEEFRFEIITDGDKPKSILIQRCVKKTDGSKVFFRNSVHGQGLLQAGHHTLPLNEYEKRWPERTNQNETIRTLRKLLKLLVEEMRGHFDLGIQENARGAAGRIWIQEKSPSGEMQGRDFDIGSVFFSIPLQDLQIPIHWDTRVAESEMQQIMRKIFAERMSRMTAGGETRIQVADKYDIHERFDRFFQSVFPDA